MKATDKHTITLEGYLRFDYIGDYYRLLIEQNDGLKIDLITRYQEAAFSFGHNVCVKWYLADKPVTRQEMQEEMIEELCGSLDAEYTSEAYHYSSWTHGTDYNSTLMVGNHDVYSELQSCQDQYIIIEISFLSAFKSVTL